MQISKIVIILFLVSISSFLVLADGDNCDDCTYEKEVAPGEYKKKDAAHYWDGCTSTSISCDNDEFRVGEETYGSTGEYSDNDYCEAEWYDEFADGVKCTDYAWDYDWLGLSQERSWSEGTQGGGASQTQCGASGGGGDEVTSGSAVYCVNPVQEPINPEPADGSKDAGENVTLEAEFNDPTGESGTLRYYNASNDNLIGSCSVQSGDRCNVSWNYLSNGYNYWYAVSDDGTSTKKSETWNFSNEAPPDPPTNPDPANNSIIGEVNPNLSVDVSDPNGDSLDVWFFNATSGGNTGWWNEDWYFRKKIKVSENSGRDLSNFQILVEDPYFDESGLVGSWHFDENSGSRVEDTSPYRNTGNINGPTWVNGRYGQALDFESSNGDYVSVSHSDELMATEEITVSAWVKFESFPTFSGYQQSYIVSKGKNDGATGHYGIEARDEKPGFSMFKDDYNVVTASNTVSTGEWHHITGVWDGSEMRLYVDGNYNGSNQLEGPISSNTGNLQIGRMGKSSFEYRTDGVIDEVRIYDRALSQNEVEKLAEPKMKPNYQDIRFVNSSQDKLDYWMENDGKFWVELSNLEFNSDKEIFTYYGNPSADSLSNGKETFLAFDDFEDSDLSNWNDPDNLLSVSSSKVKEGLNSLYWDYSGSSPKNAYLPNEGMEGSFIFEYWFYPKTKPTDDWYTSIALGSGSSSIDWRRETNGNVFYNSTNYDTEESVSEGQWYKVRQKADVSSDEMIYELNQSGNRYIQKEKFALDGSGSKIGISQAAYETQSSEGYFDIFKARKFADPMPTVDFNQEKAKSEVSTTDELIGSVKGIDSATNERPSVDWNYPSCGNEYKWYVEVSDGEFNTTTEGLWNFTVDCGQPPNPPKDPKPEYNSEHLIPNESNSVSLSANYTTPVKNDGNLLFYDNRTGDKIGECGPVSNNSRCSVTWSNLDRNKDYSWHAVADNGIQKSNKSESWSFSLNSLPKVTDVYPEDNGIGSRNPQSVNLSVKDNDNSDLTVYFYNKSDYVMIGEGKKNVASGSETGVFWEQLRIGEEYEWEVNITDGIENATYDFKFTKSAVENYRVDTEIDYKYSSLITSTTSSETAILKISNELSQEKSIKIYLKNINAYFTETGKNSLDYTLEPYEEKDFLIVVEPEEPGMRNLEVITENTRIGLNSTNNIPVSVREVSAVQESKEVPGIGSLQLIMLVLSAVFLYARS